ncbi:fibronectin type III domain-containing protein 11 [Astyanax mexicanus]|uniref:fibronectin type III domain-containing protein 11 n=1 Tax=Astyanax mexicanus TaxID=7994 RepID=UPI0020CB0677|nr:fibronectin type III domain-containing protein 11 [Astyanax mexicanus]
MEEKIRHLLNTRVTTDQIRTYFNQQEFFSRCSFYIEIKGKDLETQTTRSVPVQNLDPQRLMRVKFDAKTQVRVQLAYQTELLKKLVRSREDIAVIADKIHQGYVVGEEDDIDRKMSELEDTAAEFENSLLLGSVHNRHKLIFEANGVVVVPRLTLELKLKKPVIFERGLCVMLLNVAYLHWKIEEQEQDEPGEEFQIQYKVQDPEIHDASNRSINCGLYRAAIIPNLVPGKLYEFTINRVNSGDLVYSKWTDTIWLTTSPDC